MVIKLIERLKARLLEYLLSSSAKQEVIFKSKEYKGLEEAYDRIEEELIRLNERYLLLEKRNKRVSEDQARLILEYCRLREELFQERGKTSVNNNASGS